MRRRGAEMSMVALAATTLAAALLLTASAPRLAAAKEKVKVDGVQVERLLARWRVADAAKVQRVLASHAPRDPYLAYLGGLIDLYQGRYAKAAKTMKRALGHISNAPRRLRHMRALAASTARTWASGGKVIAPPGAHFSFRVLSPRDALLVPFALETLEAMRARLAHDLGWAPPERVRVEIYGRVTDLAAVSSLTARDIRRTGTIALCKYNRLMMVSPRALLRGYGWRDTIAHEYVHFVISRMSHNRVPIWLHEGLAKFFEARWRLGPEAPPRLTPAQQHLLAAALRPRRRYKELGLLRWRRMHPSMAKLPSQHHAALAFAQVQTAIQMIAKRKSGGLRELVLAMRDGDSPWAAVRRVTGLRRRAFNRAYRRYLRSLKLKRMPGLVPPRLRFGKRESKEARLMRIRKRKARRFFRLADMLRQRKLMRAAIIEYRKALALVGKHDSLVGNALARAYLELGEHDKATNVLLPVLAYYPELGGAQVTLGTAYLRGGNKPAATRHLKVALRVNPFDPAVHCGLARTLPAGAERRRHQGICSKLQR